MAAVTIDPAPTIDFHMFIGFRIKVSEVGAVMVGVSGSIVNGMLELWGSTTWYNKGCKDLDQPRSGS